MASAAVLQPQAPPATNLEPITAPTYKPAKFEPAKHMQYEPPSESITLESLGLKPARATSPVAVTVPFRLLSEEGIREVRADIFRREIVEKYGGVKYPGVYRIRGYGKDAPFVYDLWRSEEVRRACSQAAGVDLEIVFDYEIGQLNVQLDANTDKNAPITETLPPEVPPKESEIADTTDAAGEQANIDAAGTRFYDEKLGALGSNWHNDSYPWVCVLMLSDAEYMKGGETAIKTGSGEIVKMRQPGMGYAVMMQGGSITHAALRCVSRGERITMVTSFRPKNPLLRDTSTLATVKGISNNDTLFMQWTTYRMDVVSKRATAMKEDLETKGYRADEIKKLMADWVKEQMDYLRNTLEEMG
ncbi:hypothetical protein F5884DRAFT_731631 [Xylogone sp. PMI_703]|nr:hypothetical protein F5884DRAFT_731631 [Xylogone sp. PMI_703]